LPSHSSHCTLSNPRPLHLLLFVFHARPCPPPLPGTATTSVSLVFSPPRVFDPPVIPLFLVPTRACPFPRICRLPPPLSGRLLKRKPDRPWAISAGRGTATAAAFHAPTVGGPYLFPSSWAAAQLTYRNLTFCSSRRRSGPALHAVFRNRPKGKGPGAKKPAGGASPGEIGARCPRPRVRGGRRCADHIDEAAQPGSPVAPPACGPPPGRQRDAEKAGGLGFLPRNGPQPRNRFG